MRTFNTKAWTAASHIALLGFSSILTLGCGEIEGTSGYKRPTFVPPVSPSQPTPVLPGPGSQTRRVVILHTNDEHSHLLGYGPVSEYAFTPASDGSVDPTAVATTIATQAAQSDFENIGGIARRQYLVNKIRAEESDPVLLLSAGDATMGTLFHLATPASAPDFLAMAIMGYDFMTLGNHEFDFLPETLAAGIHAVGNLVFGGSVPIVASNIHFDDVVDGSGSAALQALSGGGNTGAPIMPWATKTLANGLKVGFLGMMGYEAALVSSANEISFSIPRGGQDCSQDPSVCGPLSCIRGRCINPLDGPAHVRAMADEMQGHVNHLRHSEAVDLVILISHAGVAEDTAVAQLTHGIDVIVGGHSHTALVEPLVVDSALSEGSTIIVQAGDHGRYLGQLAVTVDPDGHVALDSEETELLAVSQALDIQIAGSTETMTTALTLTGGVVGTVLAGLNEEMKDDLALFFAVDPADAHVLMNLQVPGLGTEVTSNHDIVGPLLFQDSNMLHLVNDANLAAVLNGLPADPIPTIGVQGNGVVREALFFGSDGTTTVADVFKSVPLGASPYDGVTPQPGYPLVKFYVTAAELYALAEGGVTRGLENDGLFLSYAGLRVSYDTNRVPFDEDPSSTTGQVTKIEITDGPQGYLTGQYDAAPLFDVTVDNGYPGGGWISHFGVTPDTYLVGIVTDYYAAKMMEILGLVPRDDQGDLLDLKAAVLCQAGGGALVACVTASGGVDPWPAPNVELKEWQALLGYLAALGNLDALYTGDTPVLPRVIDVTVP